jgi:hypothetical protein
MAHQFLDMEAELSEGSEDEEVRKELKKQKKIKFAPDSDDEEEEEEEDGSHHCFYIIIIYVSFVLFFNLNKFKFYLRRKISRRNERFDK